MQEVALSNFLPFVCSSDLQTITRLVETASMASHALEIQSDQAQLTRVTQLETVESAAQLAEAITLLTTTAHSELGRINDTAVLLRQGLHAESAALWWKDALSVIWQGMKTMC